MPLRSDHSDMGYCPSAREDMPGAVIFGVVGGSAVDPRVGYLDEPRPVTGALLKMTAPASPGEVFRIAAPCAQSACRHYDGKDCKLAKRTARYVPLTVHRLPRCPIRPRCVWFRQEGPDICLRCPGIVTEDHNPSIAKRRAADPDPAVSDVLSCE